MNLIIFSTFLIVVKFTIISALIVNYKIKKQRFSKNKLTRYNSLPKHYSYCFILWSIILIALTFLTPISMLNKLLLSSLFLIINFILISFAYSKNFNAKNHIEKIGISSLSITTGIGILITIVITFSILIEALKFFKIINVSDFLFGTKWNPQMAINNEQEVANSAFGFIPVFLGTLLITIIAMVVSVPIGIMSAIYLSMYANSKIRDFLKPALEILAGVPTVVYGYFAVIAVAPFFQDFFSLLGFEISSESAISAGFVMGIMIIPFVLSLTDDAINSVPQVLKDGALALGSTKSEMIKKVVIPSAMPSIVGAIILAVSRAIGETMIVVMSAGLVAKLTFNPLDSVTTTTAQIVTLLIGDQEFNSPKTLSAFALALMLFIFTFIFNVIALMVIKKYKKKFSIN